MLKNFWEWYERNKTLNLGIAAFLFTLQIIHLIWLFGDVVYFRLTGGKIFNLDSHEGGTNSFAETAILLVDYLEIPAIITTSLVYINELRPRKALRATGQAKVYYKNFLLLLFINSQWLHLFWITDEFVVDMFSGKETSTHLPFLLAWTAIMIDYLELPVIYDTLKKFFIELKKGDVTSALEKLKD